MARFVEIKSVNPKLKQPEKAKGMRYSSSISQRKNDDNHKEVNCIGETLPFTLQIIKI